MIGRDLAAGPRPGPVRELVSPAAVSRILADAGLSRDDPIGAQRHPFQKLPRTGGFRVRQPGVGYQVTVSVYRRDREDKARDYQLVAQILAGVGYSAERSEQLADNGALIVSKYRPLTGPEWWALDRLAVTPQLLTGEQIRAAPTAGIDGVAAEVFNPLFRSGLLILGPRIPAMVSTTGTERKSVHAVSLSAEAVGLMIERNRARQTRAAWRIIAPEHREKDPPPLLPGDPGPEPADGG